MTIDIVIAVAEQGGVENVINDITFKADKGETVAIIGSTGSGKSTTLAAMIDFISLGIILFRAISIAYFISITSNQRKLAHSNGLLTLRI